MPSADLNPRERFSNRVGDYVRYRPNYPAEAINLLEREIGLVPTWTIADVGSGTGISAEMFLRHGNVVYAVEPNSPMREAAEQRLSSSAQFHSVDGSAEATTLATQSIDCVVAAQAFHWFDAPRAREEFARILKPHGWTVLLWNTRRLDSTPFLRDYEALLQKFGTDYRQVQHNNIDAARLDAFFGPGRWQRRSLYNEQRFTLDGLRGRLLSSSYVPAQDQPGYAPMLRAVDEMFEAHQQEGHVCFEYDVEIYFGRLE